MTARPTIQAGTEGAIIVGGPFSGHIMTAPSTPITDCLRDCTAAERAALDARTPPYDGVRTWGDLLAVREQATKAEKKK